MTSAFADRVAALCEQAQALTEGTMLLARVKDIRARLDGPLRVAIAGRTKAGKSTLLNALAGERLAATDAGECTRLVTTFEDALGYHIQLRLRDGSAHELPVRRDEDRLKYSVEGYREADIERVEVGWPSSRLKHLTLVDTPGLASLEDSNSARTRDFLGAEDGGSSQADAVIYLVRHLHRADLEFLDAFFDHGVHNASPVNAVAILSRADEIGAGRLDALDSADAIARRYAADERVRALAFTVLPVAGLIAETGRTLKEREAAALRALATLDPQTLDGLLLSADRFMESETNPLPAETRRELLARLGMFGVRFCLARLQSGEAETAADLSRELVEASGLASVVEVLEGHFTFRGQVLKARSAVSGLLAVAAELGEIDAARGERLLAAIEEVEATCHELAELRLLHLVLSNMVKFSADDRAEVERLTSRSSTAERCGCAPDASVEAIRAAVIGRIDYWRQRRANPLSDRNTVEACEIVARSYEGMYA